MVDYEEIRIRFWGEDEPPRFIVHRRRQVLALCLKTRFHPRIYSNPAEVWVEAGESEEQWGEVLAWDTGAVPVYVKAEGLPAYKELGTYHVIGSTTERLELAQRMAWPGISKLSRIVFLTGPHYD